MSKEAMKLALEALEKADAIIYSEYCGTDFEELQICEPAIKALEEALANHYPDATKMVEGVKDSLTTQQEHGEPVAKYIGEDWNGSLVSLYEDLPLNTLLYTTPPPQQRKPLTDEQKNVLDFLLGANDLDGVWYGDRHPKEKGAFWWRDRLRKAFQEAAHGIKE